MTVAQTSTRPSPDSTEVEAREDYWRRVRRRVAVGYAVVLVVFVLTVGIPTDREGLLLWIVAGLSIRCLGRGWRAFGRILLDWLPFTAVLILYDYTRGFADTLGMPVHVSEPVHADLWMFHGVLPTAWLQQHLFVPGEARWYDAVVTLVYTSHFIATPVIAAILWIRNRQVWVRFISRVVTLAFVGLAGYTLYPAAPPWYAAREGIIDPIVRTTSRGWTELGLSHAGQVLSKGQATVNLVAAMPSLHTAYATLITLFFIRRVPWWGKVLLACYPVLMGVALVYSGEHYAVDVIFGWLTAGVVMLLVLVGERMLARWRAVRAAESASPVVAAAAEPAVAAAAAGAAGPVGAATVSDARSEAAVVNGVNGVNGVDGGNGPVGSNPAGELDPPAGGTTATPATDRADTEGTDAPDEGDAALSPAATAQATNR